MGFGLGDMLLSDPVALLGRCFNGSLGAWSSEGFGGVVGWIGGRIGVVSLGGSWYGGVITGVIEGSAIGGVIVSGGLVT